MFLRFILASGLVCSVALADFSYEQNSKISGGAMAGMMKVAGAFSKAAREPMRSTVMVSGNKLAMVSNDHINIIDLNAETFTDVNVEKKTYAVITFADMAKAMQRMAEKMGQAKRPEGAEMQFKADVKQTGATRVINGLNTKETILKLSLEGTDQKSGQKGAMDFTMDMWMAPDIPGYGEVRDFYMRMAQKMNWSPMANAMGPMMAGNAKGMSELMKEMSKLQGVPVLQVTRMGGSGQGMPSDADMANAQRQAEQAQAQQQEERPTATETAAGAVLGRRLGGLAGGLGGFGRRKKTEQQAEAPAPAAQPAPAAASPAPAGTLMEVTTELTGFSPSVDASKMQVPAGFRQVEHDMSKALK